MVVKKSITKKEMPIKKNNISLTQKKDTEIEKILVENFVSLQKVMTTLAVKFDNLSVQISRLLELFETSAKTMAEKGYSTGEDKKILEKLNSLLEHNKVIAKGIALLHEKEIPEEQETNRISAQQIPIQKTFPRNQIINEQETRFPRLTQEYPKQKFAEK